MRRFLVLSLVAVAGLLPVPSSANDTPESPRRVLALGDSLTAGYGLPAEESFPARLESALRAAGFAVNVIDGGVSGDTTAGGRARLGWLLAERPDLAIVTLGGNDALRGLDPAETRRNLDAILARLAEESIPTLLAGMRAPRNLGEAYVRRFDPIYAELAEKYDVALYPFFLDGVATNPDLNQADGIHPNAQGVAVIVERILPSVIALLTCQESAADGD